MNKMNIYQRLILVVGAIILNWSIWGYGPRNGGSFLSSSSSPKAGLVHAVSMIAGIILIFFALKDIEKRDKENSDE